MSARLAPPPLVAMAAAASMSARSIPANPPQPSLHTTVMPVGSMSESEATRIQTVCVVSKRELYNDLMDAALEQEEATCMQSVVRGRQARCLQGE